MTQNTLQDAHPTPARSVEHEELLTTLALHRRFLIETTKDLTDEQARATPTVSSLSIGGIVTHVTAAEREWITFVLEGAESYERVADHGPDGFVLAADDTLPAALNRYATVADTTERVINGIDDLSSSHLLPAAPWFPPGTAWSARRVLLHLIAETSQHAGHADIIRESIDGAKTMA